MKQLTPLYLREKCKGGYIAEVGILNLSKSFIEEAGWELDDKVLVATTCNKGWRGDVKGERPFQRWELHVFRIEDLSDEDKKYYGLIHPNHEWIKKGITVEENQNEEDVPWKQ